MLGVLFFLRSANRLRKALEDKHVADHFADLGHREELLQQDQALVVLTWRIVTHF